MRDIPDHDPRAMFREGRHVPVMSTMVLYAIFLNRILAETDFRRNRCVTIHLPPNCPNGYLRDTIVK